MSRRSQLLLLALGCAGFLLLVFQVGPARLAADIASAGWVIVPAVAVYAAVYLASSEAWRLTMFEASGRLSAPRAFALTAWGYALNHVTPFVSVGGEPFKIAAAVPWLGARRAAATVLGHRLVQAEAHVLFLLTGLALAIVLLPRESVGVVTFAALGGALAVLGVLVVTLHRRGGLERLLDVLVRLPVLRRYRERLDPHRPALAEVDARITELARARPRRFALALGLEYAGRCVSVLEILFIARGLGIPLGYGTVFLIAAFASLAINLFFFIPFSLGAREGGFFAIFALLGLPPELGVAMSVIGRLRELAWIAIGIALGLAGTRARVPEP